MGYARSKYVKEGQEGVYHCFCRCVRRAFLCGRDRVTGADFSHRRKMLLDRMRYLATIFAIEVCAFAIMENHYHLILRLRPDIVAKWTDREVALRWLTLSGGAKHTAKAPTEDQIGALTACPERIAELRRRLCSLSWFMGRLNEFIARAANKEDGVKGRFWEGRFKCQILLDLGSIAACMVYVDLNIIRAGLAATPESSDFTSIQERIRAWSRANAALESDSDAAFWLCPIQSGIQRRGILQMTTPDYFDLVDKSGRLVRADKRGSMDSDLAPVLARIGANPQSWVETISHFGSKFRLAAGGSLTMRAFADQIGKRWLAGMETARSVFS